MSSDDEKPVKDNIDTSFHDRLLAFREGHAVGEQIKALKDAGAPEIIDRYMPREDRRGPWDDEPEHIKFLTAEGYDANVLRGGIWKGLCGYVTVPLVHGVAQITYDREIIWSLECHGGITLADQCVINSDGDFEASDEFWTFGFDASHFRDLSPRLPDAMWDSIVELGGEYRNMAYMIEQCEKLSTQLHELQHHRDDPTNH